MTLKGDYRKTSCIAGIAVALERRVEVGGWHRTVALDQRWHNRQNFARQRQAEVERSHAGSVGVTVRSPESQCGSQRLAKAGFCGWVVSPDTRVNTKAIIDGHRFTSHCACPDHQRRHELAVTSHDDVTNRTWSPTMQLSAWTAGKILMKNGITQLTLRTIFSTRKHSERANPAMTDHTACIYC